MQRYAITDRSLLPPHPGGPFAALAGQTVRWAEAGIHFIQLREKDLPQSALATLTRQLAESIQTHHTRLLVSGLPPEQALACGADGVHLPGPIDPAAIRQAHQHSAIVSVSCHTLNDISLATAARADLILWAPVFNKQLPDQSDALPGTGLDALAQACNAAYPIPVFALGGVTLANAPSCIQAGAAGIAGIRLFHEPASKTAPP